MPGWDLRLRYVNVTLSPASVAANTSAEQLFAVPGARLDDVVVAVSKPTAQAGLGIVGWRVSSEGNIGITFGNFTGDAIPPPTSQSYTVVLMVKQP